MGGCVSNSNHQKPSTMKPFGSNDIKPPILDVDLHLPAKTKCSPSPSFPDFGSKEETFFDSQAWLDSDCDDDFMSINGEFTPSTGNTLVHHNFSADNKTPPLVSTYHLSPNAQEKKLRLSDLFKDSLRGTYDFDNEEEEEDGEAAKKRLDNPLLHAAGKTKRERFGSCFPSLLSSHSSSMNGRKMMTPGLGPSLSPGPNPVVV